MAHPQRHRFRLLITAGPTREPIDAVRYISNRSSGRLGLALAAAAAEAGHEVTLLLGPGPRSDDLPEAVKVHRFESAADLEALLGEHLPACDVLVMAAAVADYRPIAVHEGKLPSDKGQGQTLTLEPVPDLVQQCAGRRGPGQRIVAFALEASEQLEARARAKMQQKQVDAIVANPLATMDGQTIDALWLDVRGGRAASGPLSKQAFAPWLLARLESLLASTPSPAAPGTGGGTG